MKYKNYLNNGGEFMGHKSYGEYKFSNVDWIGDIPIEWGLEKLKHILIERNEKNNPIKTL